MPDERIADLTIERMPLALMLDHPRTPRDYPEPGTPKWEALVKSVQHDVFKPFVWNRRNGRLVCGHLLKRVMLSLGFTHGHAVVKDYSEPEHQARMICANEHAGDWNIELKAALARDLDASELDPALALWTPKELAALLEPPEVPDDTENVQELCSKADLLQHKWQVQPGQLWQIGAHRLLCGDCTLQEGWRRLLNADQADMVWTDPPYNIAYSETQQRRADADAKHGTQQKHPAQALINDSMSAEGYSGLLEGAFAAAAAACKPGAAIYIAHADMWRVANELAAIKAGWTMRQNLIWIKSGFTLGMQDHQWQHEPILYGWKAGGPHYWQGGHRQTTVIDEEVGNLARKGKKELVALINDLLNSRDTTFVREPRPTSNDLHPTIKPLSLVARHIWNSSRRMETVIDLFGGSGTTLLAAEHTDRRAMVTELDPKYCAVILERVTSHGLTAALCA